jgi:hypothetical protein
MKKIILIGFGEIGFRYLCGIKNIQERINILIIDNNNKSLEIGQKKLIKEGGNKFAHEIRYCNEIKMQDTNADLAIISTTSYKREKLIAEVALKAKPNYWIIEKILSQSKAGLETIRVKTLASKNTWVNTSRRLMTWHQKLKKNFYGMGKLRFVLKGGLWEMACCAIHYIDLVSFWTEEEVMSIDNSKLDNNWLKSKRKGYFEITGTLIIKFSKGSELILQSYPDILDTILHIEFPSKKTWRIDENKGIADSSDGIVVNGRLEYQSEITQRLIEEILNNGSCKLTTLKESIQQHSLFLDSMLDHWNLSNKCNDQLVPIT